MIYMIVSCNELWQIGYKGMHKLPWHQKADMERFKGKTENSIVVMGSATAKSIKRKPLKHRVNVVLTRTPGKYLGFLFANSPEFCIENFQSFYVIGGEEIYESFLPFTSQVELTRVFTKTDLDIHESMCPAYFPELTAPHWIKQRETQIYKPDKGNQYPYRYETWIKWK